METVFANGASSRQKLLAHSAYLLCIFGIKIVYIFYFIKYIVCIIIIYFFEKGKECEKMPPDSLTKWL